MTDPNLVQPPEYVIGSFDNGLVVLPLDDARRLATLNDALRDASTWGDFLRRVGDDQATLLYLADHFDGNLPEAQDGFDRDEIPGFKENAWPPFPKAALSQLPESVVRLSSIQASLLDGDLVHIEEEQRMDVTAALDRGGFGWVEDDDLIERACGDWRYGL